MRLSKRAEYGVLAASALASMQVSGKRYVRSKQLAELELLPSKYLESILLSLKSAGMLDSKVGAGGGYRFVRDPESITVSELLKVLEPATQQPMDRESVEAEAKQGTPGRDALSLLRARLDFALESAVGSLTLGDLVQVRQNDDLQRAASSWNARGEDAEAVERPTEQRAERRDVLG